MKRFRTVLQFVPRYRKHIFAGIACLVVARVLALVTPKLMGNALDEVMSVGDLSLARTLAILVVAVTSFWAVFHFAMRWYLITTSRRLERDLRNLLYSHLLRLSASFYDRRATGDLMSRASADVEQVRQALGPGAMYISNTIVFVPLALVVMIQMSASLTLLSLLPLVGIAVITRVLAPRIHLHSRRVQEATADLSTRAQESFAGARVVKVFAREANEIEEFHAESRRYLEASMGLARTRAILRPSFQALEALGALIVMYAGGRFIINDLDLTPGELLAFFAYQRLLVWPMISIGWVIALFQRGAAAMTRIDEILETEPEIVDAEDAIDPPPVTGAIEFRDLTFAYGGTEVLTDLSIRVPAGETLAVVGPTGCGKTTLVQTLLRTYPVPDGSVFLDGIDVNRYPLPHLRGAVGYVPQETFLFSDTIRENIAYGVDEATEEKVLAAATRSQLASEIREMPDGLDTLLGERGVNLSGGQKQRTAVARAVIRDPAVLVLDDAFSSVDTETEDRILRDMEEVMAARTTILIGHRVSTVKGADQIVVLSEGRVVERGTHEELLALGGRYAEMERLQRLESELEAME